MGTSGRQSPAVGDLPPAREVIRWQGMMTGLTAASLVILRGAACAREMVTTLEPAPQDLNTASAAYPDAGETMRLGAGRLRFFRTIAGSAVAGPVFGFVFASTLMLVYVNFAEGLYAVTADEAQPAFDAFSWDALAAGISLVAGVIPSLAYPPMRRGIGNSPLLKAGTSALVGTRPGD
jgi:hypothetical protein